MFQKRGQVTLFIVMFLIIGIGVFFLFTQEKEEPKEVIKSLEKDVGIDDQYIRNFIESCVLKTGKEAVFYLGFVGGRLDPDPFEYYDINPNYEIPYFYTEGVNNIPTPYDESYWTGLIDDYINDNFLNCIDKFESFEGIEILFEDISSSTEFTDIEVIFNVEFPVTSVRNFKQNIFDTNYVEKVGLRLRDIANITSEIVDKEVREDKYIHWDYLTDTSNNNYNITAYTEDDNTIIYRIIDLNNKIDNELYYFQFANKIESLESEDTIIVNVNSQTSNLLVSRVFEFFNRRQINESAVYGFSRFIDQNVGVDGGRTEADDPPRVFCDNPKDTPNWLTCGGGVQCTTDEALSGQGLGCTVLGLNILDGTNMYTLLGGGNMGVLAKGGSVNLDNAGSTQISSAGDGALFDVEGGLQYFSGQGTSIFHNGGPCVAGRSLETDSIIWTFGENVVFGIDLLRGGDDFDKDSEVEIKNFDTDKLVICSNNGAFLDFSNSVDLIGVDGTNNLIAKGSGYFALLGQDKFFPLLMGGVFKGDSSIVYNQDVRLDDDFIVLDSIYNYTITSNEEFTVVITGFKKLVQSSGEFPRSLSQRQNSLVYGIV